MTKLHSEFKEIKKIDHTLRPYGSRCYSEGVL